MYFRIVQPMSFPETIRFARSAMTYRDVVRQYYVQRFKRMLRKFFATSDAISSFFRIFHNHLAVISGSFVLAFLTAAFECDDLDLYVYIYDVPIVLHELGLLGYTLVAANGTTEDYPIDASVGIAEVYHMRNTNMPGNPEIDIVSCIGSPLEPIIHFHSTPVSV